MSYRVMVTGSRSWRPERLVERVVTSLGKKHGDDLTLVLGDCEGIDATFAEVAMRYGVNFEVFQADWGNVDRPGAVMRKRKDGTLYDAAAGPERNRKMVESGVDLCLAFHQFIGNSKGTRGAIVLALKAGVETWLCSTEDGKPARCDLGDFL